MYTHTYTLQPADLYLVFEFVENDLSGLLAENPSVVTPEHIKSYMYQVWFVMYSSVHHYSASASYCAHSRMLSYSTSASYKAHTDCKTLQSTVHCISAVQLLQCSRA
jgi:hypothetical protein